MLDKAIRKLEIQAIPVYTFSLYNDHESNRVSVCVDTKENSENVVRRINLYNVKYFRKALVQKSLKSAKLWQANVGRSLSIGDFSYVNLEEEHLRPNVIIDEEFYLSLVNLLSSRERSIIPLAPDPYELLFACSGPQDEVDLVWSAADSISTV